MEDFQDHEEDVFGHCAAGVGDEESDVEGDVVDENVDGDGDENVMVVDMPSVLWGDASSVQSIKFLSK